MNILLSPSYTSMHANRYIGIHTYMPIYTYTQIWWLCVVCMFASCYFFFNINLFKYMITPIIHHSCVWCYKVQHSIFSSWEIWFPDLFTLHTFKAQPGSNFQWEIPERTLRIIFRVFTRIRLRSKKKKVKKKKTP